MTQFNVDPLVYVSTASNLNTYAVDFHKAFANAMEQLSDSTEMGGTVGACKEWASSYDATAIDAYILASNLCQAIDNYADILQQAGYNYALADYEKGTGRPEPGKPTPFPFAWSTCPQPPPSAGGPGRGLVDDGFELASKAGVPIPDGDPDRLLAAANVWDALARSGAVAGLASKLEGAAKSFEAVTAPDASFIDEDIREMKTAAEDVASIFADIAESCREQKAAIDEMRAKLVTLLEDLAEDIATEVAVTLVCSAVAGALSAGFGAAAVAAYRAGKIAEKVATYAGKIKGIVEGAKLAVKIKTKKAISSIREKLQRIIDLVKKRSDDAAEKGDDEVNVPKKGPLPRFNTTELDPHYVGEEVPGNSIWPGSNVKYLTEEERKAYQLFVRDGKIYDANGNLFDTSAASTAHSPGGGRAIFVMDENGNMYASTRHAVGEFHHSSFLGGKPVAGAGELQVVNGELKLITDQSGHYKPAQEYTQQVISNLQGQGVQLNPSQVQMLAPR
ncbi:hypothetical protein APR11_002229 [Nocardia amikacinitolerans]|uniref:hypothetical protein n=1 Tax=Nocardia amikacinitolerans TaxID=756689 RepID=UPI0020A33F55|nr:hypothetical protein [Nocardia amikacinitolerans]MCP2295811.1 hypothetical protein [Nocardia amikacinitolerans]